jgi:putative ABC transport system permease protein
VAIPLKYNLRNLIVRRVSTGMTVFVIGLVVTVFIVIMSLVEGMRRTLSKSVSDRNIIVMRVGAQSEMQSYVAPDQVETLRTLLGVERDARGEPVVSPELVVLVNTAKRDGTKTNIQVRGVHLPVAFEIRRGLRMIRGRTINAGTDEAIVSKSVARRFANCEVGDLLKAGSERWRVVGVFDGRDTPFDSEIWVDFHNLEGQIHRTPGASSVTLRASDSASRDQLIASVKGDQRVKLEGKTEKKYYAEQMVTAEPIRYLAWIVGVMMAIGASFGAMNTMYAQVSARTREIGTLRSLGFSRRSILLSFLAESLMLAVVGGVLGIVLAIVLLRTILTGPVGTNNFRTFSDILFNFRITPSLAFSGFIFSIAMGAIGGLFPAFRAARLKIVAALREV